MKLILDVSNVNGSVNFAETKKHGVVAALLRVTEGLSGPGSVDETFHAHLVEAQKAGLVVGAYHYAHQGTRPSLDGAREEANHYVETMRRLTGHKKPWQRGDFKPVLDFEVGTPDHAYSGWRDAFQAEIARLTGHSTILYTYPGFNPMWRTPSKRSQRSLWIADYGTNLPIDIAHVQASLKGRKPTVPAGYKRWSAWQFTSKLTIPGVHGVVDCSVLPSRPFAFTRLRCTRAG